jgi:hypothetical protein
LVDFVDVSARKTVDFEILEPKIGFRYDNYFGVSSGMEIERVHRLIIRQKSDSIAGAKVAGYIHDRDAKARKPIAGPGDSRRSWIAITQPRPLIVNWLAILG